MGCFERAASEVTRPRVVGGQGLLRRFTSADPVAVHGGREGIRNTEPCGWKRVEMRLRGAALVTMMESADFRDGNNAAHARRLDRVMFRCVLFQSQVRPAPMMVVHETLQVTGQAPFAEHDHVVQAFAADGANDPFHISSLPGGTQCR